MSFLNIIAHSTINVKISEKMKRLYIYPYSTAPDYSMYLKLIYDLPHENVKFSTLNRLATGIRLHPIRVSADSAKTGHYTKWIPVK